MGIAGKTSIVLTTVCSSRNGFGVLMSTLSWIYKNALPYHLNYLDGERFNQRRPLPGRLTGRDFCAKTLLCSVDLECR